MKTKMRFTLEDYLKANRKIAREEELTAHGKPVRINRIHKSKKAYDRKMNKAELKKALPYLFMGCRDFFVNLKTEINNNNNRRKYEKIISFFG